MISSLLLKNFKSISMDEPIGLKGFSILCGSNSSGKSSLIQSILLLCQTFSNRYQDSSIVLNGHLCRLGGFQDIKSHGSSDENVVIRFSIPFDVPVSYSVETTRIVKVECEVEFGRRKKLKPSPEDDFHPVLLKAKYEIMSISPSGELRDFIEIAQSREEEESSFYTVVDSSLSNFDKVGKDYPGYKILGCSKANLFPSTFLIEYDHTKKVAPYVVSLVAGDEKKRRPIYVEDVNDIRLPSCFFKTLRHVIDRERTYLREHIAIPKELLNLMRKDSDIVGKIKEVDLKRYLVEANFALSGGLIDQRFITNEYTSISEWLIFLAGLEDRRKKNLSELIDKYRLELQDSWYKGSKKAFRKEVYNSNVFSEAGELLSYYFSRSVKYLGPLRNEPQAVYASLGYLEPNNVGLKGEYTAAALHINKLKPVAYLSPLRAGLDGFSTRHKTATLKDACQDWLSYLGVVEEFRTIDKGKLGYELLVKTNKSEGWQDLTHVGVGVSQVLPIILMFLLSSPDDVLIFEQPELHLHPKIQSRLCDLFLAMAEANRQCLIETHSEYMINRLRLRIVQDHGESVINKSALYFISKTDGRSAFENIKISKYGVISNWPKDFFDQTDREIERIVVSATKKKKQERSNVRSD
ncbi:DUF3696 domain-containing protein [Pseudomonas viridiflava]|uniref:AAA family ATPase n=1 Tax=Pseudomonas viridiflava TaxID=33069 RepID=UPI002EC55CFD|nr:DUF3696 domain-containing protein [Pseudomonas viridiflava]